MKGDLKSLSVAAASVLAKVHRDSLMKQYDEIKPEYYFAKNKGYKCDAHYAGLDQSGIWVGIHRTSLFPLRKKKGEDKEWTKRRQLWVQNTGDLLCQESEKEGLLI